MYAIINTDRMSGTYDGSKLLSVKYFVGTTATAIQNGSIVYVDGTFAASTNREVFKAVAVADADGTGYTVGSGKIAIIASPEHMTDERKKNLDEFTNAAEDVCRAYILCKGDLFSVTEEAFASGAVPTSTNHIVTLTGDAAVTMSGVSSAVYNKIGEFVGSFTMGSKTFYTIRVSD